MKKTKEQKGITLIALVITIIILLILAGIVISQLTNSNIFNRAQVAVDKYNTKAGQAEVVIGQLESLLEQYAGGNSGGGSTPTTSQVHTITYNANGGTGSMNAETSTTAGTNGFTPPTGKSFKGWNTAADGSGTSYAPGAAIPSDVTLYAIWGYTAESVLAIGTEVSINGEQFYVLEASDATQSTVTLITKYNLSTTPDATTGKYYQQPNVDYEETACALTNTVYWTKQYGDRLDLNEYTTAEVASANNQTAENNVIMRARDYPTNTIGSGATGRLLTSAEANALKTDYATMIFGKANQRGTDSSNYGLLYWLSILYERDYANGLTYDDVEIVSGSVDKVARAGVWHHWEDYIGGIGHDEIAGYAVYYGYGVRPVVTVSKTVLQ